MITWAIKGLFATLSSPEIDALRPNGAIVVRVEWQVSGVDRNIAATVSGFQEFTYDPATEFIPYYHLTEAQVLSWVHAAMGDQRKTYEAMVLQQIEQKKAEPLVLPLPWHQPAPIMVEQPSDNDTLLGGNDTLLGGNGNDSLGGL